MATKSKRNSGKFLKGGVIVVACSVLAATIFLGGRVLWTNHKEALENNKKQTATIQQVNEEESNHAMQELQQKISDMGITIEEAESFDGPDPDATESFEANDNISQNSDESLNSSPELNNTQDNVDTLDSADNVIEDNAPVNDATQVDLDESPTATETITETVTPIAETAPQAEVSETLTETTTETTASGADIVNQMKNYQKNKLTQEQIDQNTQQEIEEGRIPDSSAQFQQQKIEEHSIADTSAQLQQSNEKTKSFDEVIENAYDNQVQKPVSGLKINGVSITDQSLIARYNYYNSKEFNDEYASKYGKSMDAMLAKMFAVSAELDKIVSEQLAINRAQSIEQ